jgi:hypothetical protein
MATPDIRDTEKPNVLKSDKSGYGELVTPSSGWVQQAPDTDAGDMENNQDPYTPQMLGGPDRLDKGPAPGETSGPGQMDHNSDFLKKAQIPQD